MFSQAIRWLLTVGFLSFAGHWAFAQAPANPNGASKPGTTTTTVYLVRHAEKDTVGHPADPALTAVGEARAQALRRQLARHPLAALFTTDTRRTRATLAPLAATTGLPLQPYDARQPTVLVTRILQEFRGRAVVVVGHSNTLLPLIEALGGTPPVQEIGDNDYDYLFTVRLVAGAQPTVVVRRYGPRYKPAAAARARRKAASSPAMPAKVVK